MKKHWVYTAKALRLENKSIAFMIRKENETVSIKYKLYLLLYERIKERLSIGKKERARMLLKRILAPVFKAPN